MTRGAGQDLAESELQVVGPGAGERPADVQHAGTLPIRDRVADRGRTRFQAPLRISGGRGKAAADVSRQPQHAERAVGSAAHDRPGRRDPLLRRTHTPGAGHDRHRLQEEADSEHRGEHRTGHLTESERLEAERAREGREPEPDQTGHRHGRERRVRRWVRERGKEGSSPPPATRGAGRRPPRRRRARPGHGRAADEPEAQSGADREEGRDRPGARPGPDRQPGESVRLGRADEGGERASRRRSATSVRTGRTGRLRRRRRATSGGVPARATGRGTRARTTSVAIARMNPG